MSTKICVKSKNNDTTGELRYLDLRVNSAPLLIHSPYPLILLPLYFANTCLAYCTKHLPRVYALRLQGYRCNILKWSPHEVTLLRWQRYELCFVLDYTAKWYPMRESNPRLLRVKQWLSHWTNGVYNRPRVELIHHCGAIHMSYLPILAKCHYCSSEKVCKPSSSGGNSFNTSLSSVAYYAFTGGMHKPRVKHHLAMKVNL